MHAIDFETYLISEEHPFPKPVCLSYLNADTEEVGLVKDNIEGKLAEMLQGHVIAHNAVFECGVIYEWYPNLRAALFRALEQGRIHCTKIREELIANLAKKPPAKFSLADCVERYFQEDISESKKDPNAWRLRYSELVEVPLEQWPVEATEYAISDSIWAWKVFKKQKSFNVNEFRPVRAAVMLNLMAAVGMEVDQTRVQQLEDEVYAKLSPMYSFLTEQGYCSKVEGRKRPGKNIAILRTLVSHTVKNPILTAKGTPKTDKEALEHYYGETGNPIFKAFLDISEYEKILTAYLTHMHVNRIRTSYSTTKSTGRTSCSGTTLYPSLNIQQMPRGVDGVTWDIRNCFVPRPGYKYFSIDYSALELSAAAHQLKKHYGRSKMADKLNAGDSPPDLHSHLAAEVMSRKEKRVISYEEFLSRKKEKEFAEYRQLCKAINLGFPGGLGYDTMRHILLTNGIRTKFEVLTRAKNEHALKHLLFPLRMEEPNLRLCRIGPAEYGLVYDELVGLKQDFFKLYPELEDFLRQGHKRFMTGHSIKMKDEWGDWKDEEMYAYDIYGFKRDWSTYTAFCNGYLMQTPSAIGATNAVSKVIETYLGSEEVIPLAFIHDEIVGQVKDTPEAPSHVQKVAEIMVDEMQSTLSSVRVSVEATITDYWMKGNGEWTKQFWKNVNSSVLKEK